jgi:hypothetical protein
MVMERASESRDARWRWGRPGIARVVSCGGWLSGRVGSACLTEICCHGLDDWIGVPALVPEWQPMGGGVLEGRTANARRRGPGTNGPRPARP